MRPNNAADAIMGTDVMRQLLRVVRAKDRRIVEMRHGLGKYGLRYSFMEITRALNAPGVRGPVHVTLREVRDRYSRAIDKMAAACEKMELRSDSDA